MFRASFALILSLAACGGSKPATPTAPPVEGALEAVEAEVKATLDPSVDPCTDFYAYACGGWMASFELPPDRSRYGRSFTAISDRNQEIVRTLVESPAPGSDPRLGAYYAACIDTDAIEAAGTAALDADLARIDAATSAEALLTTLVDLPLAGAFMGAFVEADFKNPDMNMFMLAQGGLGLPTRDDYFPEAGDAAGQSLLADYTAHVRTMLELAGRDPASAAGVLAVETALARASRPPDQLRDMTAMYHPKDMAGLQSLAPAVPWGPLFTALGLPDGTTVNVLTPEFFPALGEVLATTPVADLQAYAAWHLISGSASYLPAAFDQANFAFYGTRLSGQQQQLPRWKRCVDSTDGALGDLLGQAFVDRAFAGDSKAKALEMILDIQAAFEQGLPSLAWMDDATRAEAVNKLRAITNKIGYPDTWETYAGLDIGDNLYRNAVATARWEQADQLAEVGKPVDKSKWFMSPPTVNAYYNPLINEIVFPAGIMQPPFFDASFPAAMNYGAMGMVMGHEVTHGFDDEGRKFAPNGEMRTWWEPEASERFEVAAACVDETYSAIEVLPGVTLNGKLTLGENIADFGGIKLAVEAYQLWMARGGRDPSLAGLSPEQLLFVGYAQSWCSEQTEEIVRLRAKTDPHSPPAQRVNVPLSHLPAFWEAFECPEGAPMRVAEACAVW